MSEAEKNIPIFIFPDDSSAEEEAIKQSLEDSGFPDNLQDGLVRFFKRPDTFGDPSGASVFRIFFEDELKSALNTVKERVQVEDDCQTSLALLFSLMLDFGT